MIGSDSTFRDQFLTGAARAFFVTAYADYVENACEDCDGDPTNGVCAHDLPRPGPGEDWNDYAPEPPPNAYALAGEMWAWLAAVNGANVYALRMFAEEADGKPVDAEDFGWYLAMESMGHGVSWFDNHKQFKLKCPRMEVTLLSFDPACYGVEP